MTDKSTGYEAVAAEFIAGRGRAPATGIGAREVRAWARALPASSSVLDLGCGTGLPITRELIEAGLDVHAVDGSPSFVAAFRRNFPDVPVECESVLESTYFNRQFDAVIAWGLVFLLFPAEQRQLINRMSNAIVAGGRLLFTSPPRPQVWIDAMTAVESRSLGAEEYRAICASAGVVVAREYEDVGENHYYESIKPA
ncbi:MAG TPA: class I SAM-dependent methyltransferase [Gemmatimonadales bacterium]|jgi:SAM-dependent methyltransferase